ncbi:MAG: septal ring lytic transglycosylase RlpA family protein [Actinomycetota bacterium]|nr:septal ring lytic transglycosylase RlpA family protein [Actinomycetota bacterium]
MAGLAAAAAAPTAASAPTATDTISANARHHVLAGETVRVAGRLGSGQDGRTVVLRVRHGRGWKTVDRARTARGGRYVTQWAPKGLDRYGVRVGTADGSAKRSLEGGVTVYRRSAASWYGPGFYGRRTACGQTLGRGTLGVAHKSLPCGTKVALRYKGRNVVAPVIDRGPYAGNREYDLTAETKERLRFGSTGTVWSSPQS